MGMYHNFIRLSEQELAGLLANPPGIAAFLHRFIGCDPNPRRVDIDKAWHGLQIILAMDPDLGHRSGGRSRE